MTAHLAGLARASVAVMVLVMPHAACGSSVRTAVPTGGGDSAVPADYPVNILESTEHRDLVLAQWQKLFERYGVPPERRKAPDLQPFTHTPQSILGAGPIRLASTATGAPLDEERLRLLVREFLSANSELLGVAASSLSLESVADAGKIGKRYSFVQAGYAFPIAPPYGRLDMIVTPGAEIVQVSDTAIPPAGLPAEPRISRDAARQRVVGTTFTYSDIAGRPQQETVADANAVEVVRLVVYPEETPAALRIRLAWEVTAGAGLSWTVFVDAITGDVVGTRQNFQT